MTQTLLLITSSPHSHQGKKALDTAKELLEKNVPVLVFFYGDGAYTANRLIWQTADVPSIPHAWCALAQEYNLKLPVCVSTALARGVSDKENAKRHGLTSENLLTPFYLVGLSELLLQITDDTTLIQF